VRFAVRHGPVRAVFPRHPPAVGPDACGRHDHPQMADRVKRLYEQMPEPKYVIAMGSWRHTGGPFYKDSYCVVKGVDLLIPSTSTSPAARRAPRR